MQNFTDRSFPKYTERRPNGEMLFESRSMPSLISCEFYKPSNTMENLRMSADEDRSFDAPFQFENFVGSSRSDRSSPHAFYRTSNQTYGRYLPTIYTSPSIFRPQYHAFTDMLRVGRDYHHRTLNTNTKNLPSIWAPHGALPMSIFGGNSQKHSLRRSYKM